MLSIRSAWVYVLKRLPVISKLPEKLKINSVKLLTANILKRLKRDSSLMKSCPLRSRKREKRKKLLLKMKKHADTKRIRSHKSLQLSAKLELSLLQMHPKSMMVHAPSVTIRPRSFGLRGKAEKTWPKAISPHCRLC